MLCSSTAKRGQQANGVRQHYHVLVSGSITDDVHIHCYSWATHMVCTSTTMCLLPGRWQMASASMCESSSVIRCLLNRLPPKQKCRSNKFNANRCAHICFCWTVLQDMSKELQHQKLLKKQVICKATAFAFEMSDAKGCFDMACPLETW